MEGYARFMMAGFVINLRFGKSKQGNDYALGRIKVITRGRINNFSFVCWEQDIVDQLRMLPANAFVEVGGSIAVTKVKEQFQPQFRVEKIKTPEMP